METVKETTLKEIPRTVASGIPALLLLLAGTLATIGGFVLTIRTGNPWLITAMVAAAVVLLVLWFGLFSVEPNEGKVLQLFGAYVGTVREPGLKYANPFYGATAISLRIRNFESGKLKVNDQDGSPIEIAAVVVWRVIDTAEAAFEVDDYENYVKVQSEAALRNLATQYPYDAHAENVTSLRANTQEIALQLRQEVQNRLARAGVEVLETRISHLAYSPEIAAAMLRRQQASAIIAARAKIVEGAVGMVEMALAELEKKNVVDLDPERKAQMVSNLLVVLCGEHEVQPVVNTGTIHS